jgi:lipopolysaccharide export system protein LptA
VKPIQDMIAPKLRILSRCFLAYTAAALMAGLAYAADEKKPSPPDKAAEDQPILINADQLVSNNEKKYAEFIGNVKASQADFVITSDKLRIYYEGDLLDSDEKSDKNEEMLKKIVAEGNVKIKSAQYTAESEKVEYDTATMTITMTGDSSKVISGKNSISGTKIILYRKDGRVKVLGSKKKRVEATFYSGGQASDAFKMDKPKE